VLLARAPTDSPTAGGQCIRSMSDDSNKSPWSCFGSATIRRLPSASARRARRKGTDRRSEKGSLRSDGDPAYEYAKRQCGPRPRGCAREAGPRRCPPEQAVKLPKRSRGPGRPWVTDYASRHDRSSRARSYLLRSLCAVVRFSSDSSSLPPGRIQVARFLPAQRFVGG